MNRSCNILRGNGNMATRVFNGGWFFLACGFSFHHFSLPGLRQILFSIRSIFSHCTAQECSSAAVTLCLIDRLLLGFKWLIIKQNDRLPACRALTKRYEVAGTIFQRSRLNTGGEPGHLISIHDIRDGYHQLVTLLCEYYRLIGRDIRFITTK